MTRRTLLKLLGLLLPLIGPSITHAFAKSGSKLRRVYGPYLPAEFPKWDKAYDGLECAGKWAMDLERSRLPSDLVFPRLGEVWEAVRDCEVSFRASIPFRPKRATVGLTMRFAAPADVTSFMHLGFGTAKLSAGERIRVISVDDPKPIQVSFLPLRYHELEDKIVPEQTRQMAGYSGYELQLKTARTISDFSKDICQAYFTDAFSLVENPA